MRLNFTIPAVLALTAFAETGHLCPAPVAAEPAIPSVVPCEELAMLSQPVTSFGAAISDGYLYLYGGHTGRAHSYSLEEQGHTLTRLNLDTKEWQTLIEGPRLQGLALVAHDGRLYRVGGFTAKNARGEDDDLWSQSSVASFDPGDDAWTALPSLPEPRSSFDAAVVGDAIHVVGGWSLQGGAEPYWHTTAWKMDLTQQPLQWQPLPSPPFQRRALAVAAHNGKLYVIGGMQHEGGPTRRVDVFDPATGAWSQGPDLIGDEGMAGFGAAACEAGGRLYVSTITGDLQCLSADGARWELFGKTPTARFFHRMLSLDEGHLVVIGGANMESGKFEEVEVLEVDARE